MVAMIVILLGIIVILGYIYFQLTQQLNKVTNILDDINSGNSNRKFLIKGNASVTRLGIALNDLMVGYRLIQERTTYLEKLRIQIITDISHDIRTPLTSLLGYAEALRNDENLTDEEYKLYLNIVLSKGTTIYKMMDEFFELSKLDEDKDVELKEVDINEKARQVIATFYHEFTKEHIVPKIIIPEEPIYVMAVESELERILMNLVLNALKYGKEGGVIGIEVRPESEKVWIDVWDQGRGILENDITLIFERLYMSDYSRNEKQRGSGLGLSITKRLVEKMNGEIGVTSIPSEKTVFSFYLHRAKY